MKELGVRGEIKVCLHAHEINQCGEVQIVLFAPCLPINETSEFFILCFGIEHRYSTSGKQHCSLCACVCSGMLYALLFQEKWVLYNMVTSKIGFL